MTRVSRKRAPPRRGKGIVVEMIYAGVSPDTGKPLYAAARDAPMMMSWRQAAEYAAGLNAESDQNWRLPTHAELALLRENCTAGALSGTFNRSGSSPGGWYWSSVTFPYNSHYAWIERFTDGIRLGAWKGSAVSVRLVRSGP